MTVTMCAHVDRRGRHCLRWEHGDGLHCYRLIGGHRRARDRRRLKAQLLERSGGACEATCSTYCRGVGAEIHHRLRRSQGGKGTAGNTIFVCAPCHREAPDSIHNQPARSYARGWLLRREAS